MQTRPVYVAGSARVPFFKSLTKYQSVGAMDLMVAPLVALVEKLHLEDKILGDVALGSLMNLAYSFNFARECVLSTKLDAHTPAYNVQRACGTSLDTTLQIALRIANYQIEVGISGGVDTNSDIPAFLQRSLTQKLVQLQYAKSVSDKLKILASIRPGDLKPKFPDVVEPRTGLSMGQHCEKMVQEWGISQAAQDEIALQSHLHAAAAYKEGFYDDLIIDFMGAKRDGIVRDDTSLEKLGKLKPAFDQTGIGTITAGNASPLTDGSACVLLVSEEAATQNNYPMLARFVDAQTAAVDYVHGDGLLMAPTIAVSELLKRNKLSLQDFDIYEIHEAFAGQVACTLKAWESEDYCKRVLKRDQAMGAIDRTKMNVKGGSVALGHPFAATGARIVGALAKQLHQRGKGRGLISICTAGGMGVAAIMEAV